MVFLLSLLAVAQAQAQPPFKEQVVDNQVSIGYGVAIGDVDGDKKPDILLADKKQIAWYRNGDWKKHVIAENLTQFDNVCIAARDVNGDGKVEIAVGAQWNPGETSDTALSGSVHYLQRPKDPTQKWKVVTLHHEPTVHRMRWVKQSDGKYFLVVLPLHGRGNKNGEGEGVKILAYEFPKNVNGNWPIHVLSQEMHLTHNMADKENASGKTEILVAGKEGIRVIDERFDRNNSSKTLPGKNYSSGEIKIGKNIIATIEPMHGNKVVVYEGKERVVLDSLLNEGHAVGVGDFSGSGSEQVVAGWRNPDKDGQVGVKIYSKKGDKWISEWIDKNGMACEDLQVADLNADGKPDIIASGRSSKNLKIYWNTSK